MKQQGIGFFSILGLIFITLKLLAIQPVADWSWWLVLLPLYGGLALVLALGWCVRKFESEIGCDPWNGEG